MSGKRNYRTKNTHSRSSRLEVFCNKDVLKNFTKFTGKHLCQSFFASSLRPATLLKERLWHRYFPVNFVKFLRTPISAEHLWWLLLILYLSKFQYEWQRIKKQTENVLLTAFFLLTVVKSEFSSEKDDE